MATAISLAPLLRQSVGFDRFNELLETALHSETATCYPPHNIERYGEDHYRIVVAAAGLTADDLNLQVDKGVLTVCAGERQGDAGATYLYQGIAHGAFRLVFHLAEPIEVQGATFENGLLIIFLLRVVPEAAKARRIIISPAGGPDRRQLNRH
ncbi:Hsp20 family protein [Pseudomonas sp. NPDC087358]|jgi:molecular chaperone IbpA|uniref:Hsp20 family protein n=1 Tax=Pseudomonas sp. NPDC087358 TaxID=3364439 RepID=UPI00384F3A95